MAFFHTRMMRAVPVGLALLISACSTVTAPEKTAVLTPIPVKVVIVSLFEIGADEGDQAGEFQLWKTRQHLDTQFPFKQSFHDIYMNEDTGVLGIVTGIGTARSTAAVMALGLDPRFDLSHAYWLVAGIAGIDPEDAPIGSAAWANYVVDGDLGHEIDAREIPKDWSTGYFPRHTETPWGPQKTPFDVDGNAAGGEVFALNHDLVEWAYQLTKDIELPEYPGLASANAPYRSFPNAAGKPVIIKGDNLAAMTFWHGQLMNDWANRWVDYWTQGHGEFVTSAMEDTGVMQALTYLTAIGAADKQRALVLRGGSNYTLPPPGVSAADNLLNEKNHGYSGLDASLETLYQAGSKVVQTLLSDWDTYRDTIPAAAAQ